MKSYLFGIFASVCFATNWTVSENSLFYKGDRVVLRGFGTSCTPNLIKGLGETCWNTYNWNDKENIITELNHD